MKNSEQNQLDQLLKDELSEGTAQVPGFVWDRIEEELFPEKKRRGFFWWFFGGLCILLIGAFIAIAVSGQGVHSQNNSSPNGPFSAHNYREQGGNRQVLNENQKAGNTLPENPKTTGRIREFSNPGTKQDKLPGYATVRSIQTNRQKSTAFGNSKKEPKSSFSATGRSKKELPFRAVSPTNRAERNGSSSIRAFSNQESKSAFISPSQLAETKDYSSQQEKREHPDSTAVNAGLIPRSNSGNQTKEAKNAETKGKNGPKSEAAWKNEPNYAEIVEILKKDFPEIPHEQEDQTRPSRFSIGISGGPSLYHSAVFKDYFTSGQLSKRTFASSGLELGLQTRIQVSDRFKIYAGLAFNQKQTQFTYNLAITQADYFTYVVNHEKVPLENIRDDGANSCFLAKDVTVKYQMQSVLLALGTSFEFLRIGKFTAAADLRLSGNVYASLKLKEMQVLAIAQPQSEKFSYLQPGAGLSLNYQVNNRLSLGIAPFFSKQFYLKSSFSRKLDELIIPLTVSFNL